MEHNELPMESPGNIDDRALMRLIDGELSVEQRRRLIQELDGERGGWRRCAALFLEDQALRTELEAPAATPTSLGQLSAVTNVNHRTNLTVRRSSAAKSDSWKSFLAIAVSVVAAYCFGLATHTPQTAPTAYPDQLAEAPSAGSPNDQMAYSNPAKLPRNGWDTLYVHDRNFWDGGSVVPADVIRSLEEGGAQVHRQRGFVPVRMQDGRHVAVPYEDYHVVPVHSAAY